MNTPENPPATAEFNKPVDGVIIHHIDCEVEGVHERQFIAIADRIVGRVGVKAKGAPFAEMRQLYVVPDWRGLGVGNALVAECILYALNHKCPTLNLTVAKCNHSVMSFYTPKGFLPVYQFTDEEIVMVLQLTARHPQPPTGDE